jgi:acylphosphatase
MQSDRSAWRRREIRFHGRVQGVGFRYTTERAATHFRVTGYVQNLPDGSVRVVAEGEPAELDGFVGGIREAMARNIRNEHSEDLEATGEFADFRVRY